MFVYQLTIASVQNDRSLTQTSYYYSTLIKAFRAMSSLTVDQESDGYKFQAQSLPEIKAELDSTLHWAAASAEIEGKHYMVVMRKHRVA